MAAAKKKTVKLKTLTTIQIGGEIILKGEVLEVPETDAKELISRELAIGLGTELADTSTEVEAQQEETREES